MRAPLKIVLGYFLVSVLWIGASDAVLAAWFPTAFPVISIYKGWGFVALTAALLYGVLEREWRLRDIVEKELKTLTVYDPLTGLLNRTAFGENLERAIAVAARKGDSVGVLFLDLDGFKEINDRHGHHVGDEFLAEVAKRLKETARSSDGIARFGGDEFLMLVVGDKAGVERLAERVIEAMRQPFPLREHEMKVTASVGYAMYPEHGDQGEELIRAADFAMYRVKKHGKNSIQAATPVETRIPTSAKP